MKILVVFTGGTIGSSLSEGVISPNDKNARMLLETYKAENKNHPEFAASEPYYALSENNTGETLSSLIFFVCNEIKKDYDGIIIAHGTDTLQYSAAALSYALGLNSKPVLLVSSNYVLTDKRANGLENFSRAVDFIRENHGTGVFVSYKNSDDRTYIHRASRLTTHHEYSDDIFSIKNLYYGSFNGDTFIKNPDFTESADEILPFGKTDLKSHSESIAVFQPYVGIKWNEPCAKVKAVLIKTYHSGTLCTADTDLKKFTDKLKSRGIPCFLCGAGNAEIYESAEHFSEYGFKTIPPSSFISQYIKLWLALEHGIDFGEIYDKSLGGDLLP